jgi:hypothetical protein
MRDFLCPNCGQHLAFENSVCLSCGSALGFSLDRKALLVIASGEDGEHGGAVDSSQYQLCANLHVAECNWLVTVNPGLGAAAELCASCRLTRSRPNDADTAALAAFAAAEKVKRRLVVELADLKLPIVGRDEDPRYGLAFDLLSSQLERVVTGHHYGVITLNLAEGDDVHREQLRIAMGEPYRTLLGHLRHEIGHYYFYRLVRTSQDYLWRFGALFGDPDTDYQAALDWHYTCGAPPGWKKDYVSSYATMHAAEDWAETFAHYLHIRDTLDTAAAFGFAPSGATFGRRMLGPSGFDTIVERWLPLAWALNMVNRSMGRDDLYPFVLPAVVLDKMRFIHTVIDEMACDPAKLVSVGAAVREHVTGEYLAQQRPGDSSGRLEGARNA